VVVLWREDYVHFSHEKKEHRFEEEEENIHEKGI